jgi:hypothetical protein
MKPKWIEALSPRDRLELAGKKVEAMLDVAIELVHLHATNQLICYSDLLKRQIPRSYAGVAFRIFSKALLQRELAAVCTFWDSCAEHRNSVPTVVELIDDERVKQLVYRRKMQEIRGGRHLSAEDDDPKLLAWVTELSDRDALASASRRSSLLTETVARARSVVESEVLQAARDFRNGSLSHNLSPEARQFPQMHSKYGDEGHLLETSQDVLEDLNLVTRSASYDWQGTWRIAERNAAALWSACTLKVLE